MLQAMRRPTPATVVLAVLWIGYAIGGAWLVYRETPLLSRDLLLILTGYGAIVAAVTALIILRIRLKSSKRISP
jgi:hypothetical protein